MTTEVITILVSICLPLIVGIIYLIRTQMNINTKIFLEIASIKKDVDENKRDISENYNACKKIIEQNSKNCEKILDNNRDEHHDITLKVDSVLQWLLDNK